MSGALRKILNYYKLISIHFAFNEVTDATRRYKKKTHTKNKRAIEGIGENDSFIIFTVIRKQLIILNYAENLPFTFN